MMNNYETLLDEANNYGLRVKEIPLISSDGRIKGNKIGIRKDIKTSREKSCVLAEELGHHRTSVGNIIDINSVSNRKQERQARLWGYNKMFGLRGLIRAFEHGCASKHEIAEYLDVTTEFLNDAITTYREKYGICTTIDNYIIYFIPYLAIMEKI